MLVADADVPGPVIRALQALKYPIKTYHEIGAPVRPDSALMNHVLCYSRVLVTGDAGIPSQAYAGQFAAKGLTVVLLRWKTATPLDFQEMAMRILRDGASWEEIASHTPSIISANKRSSRARPWTDLPNTMR